MLRILAPLVLALPALAQFPQIGLYAQRQRPPALQLVQSSTIAIPMAEAHARLARIGNGPPPPDSSSCRVTERTAPWDEVRNNQAADHEPQTIAVEACIPVSLDDLMEALGGFFDPTVTTTGAAIQVQGALDPSFGVPVFDVTVPLPDHTISRAVPFDGSDDFAGASGGIDHFENALFQRNVFSVAPFGSFFQQDGWQMFVRARIVDSSLSTHMTGLNLHFTRHWLAAAGVVTVFDPPPMVGQINDDWHDVAREATLIDNSHLSFLLENRKPDNWPGTIADAPQVWRVEKSPLGDRTKRVTLGFAWSAIRVLGFQDVDLGIENQGSLPLDNVIAQWKGDIEFRTCPVSRRLPGVHLYTQPWDYLYSTPHLDGYDGSFDCIGASGKKWVLNTLWYEGRTLLPTSVEIRQSENPQAIAAFCVDAPGDPGFAHFQVVPHVADEWSATGPQGQTFTQDTYGHLRMCGNVFYSPVVATWPEHAYIMLQYHDTE